MGRGYYGRISVLLLLPYLYYRLGDFWASFHVTMAKFRVQNQTILLLARVIIGAVVEGALDVRTSTKAALLSPAATHCQSSNQTDARPC